ncbi:tetratricopeptide repeat protein [Croceitalea rosinachiae]|uniref:Tetratricopeptide repeat-containing protein n=1 Tax=Croceitalea rosinachiae TaxID=3075596 RepID=A0ABU3AC31_9FLAO|nr:hypothetical protein [Croceitalea sp. F388]MDT0607112.1 hypothetical protein [Croceitalea sp. F388]
MKYLVILCTVVLVISCSQNSKDFETSYKDYNAYLKSRPHKNTSKYYTLWNSKITKDSTQLLSFGNVASEYNRYFKNTGDFQFLKKAEQALSKAVEIANINKEGYCRALARNYISQHRFKEALILAQEAISMGAGSKATRSLLFDVHMELGNYQKAEAYLDSIRNPAEFGYLIRAAKWNDYKGDLDTTIEFMEKAMAKAEASKNKDLLVWSYSNIADYYGHAGRFKDSYEHYLKTLAIDHQNAYAKKGIAWIVFSHEKNGTEALRILDSVMQDYKSPDYYLLKAEIADFMNNTFLKRKNHDLYDAVISNKAYGAMYNAYNVDFILENTDQFEKALKIASEEVNNRATPESYSLLAHVYLKKEDYIRALEIVNANVIGKTYEPALLLNAAEVYKANHQFEKVKEIKLELADAIYELGPASKEKIASL